MLKPFHLEGIKVSVVANITLKIQSFFHKFASVPVANENIETARRRPLMWMSTIRGDLDHEDVVRVGKAGERLAG